MQKLTRVTLSTGEMAIYLDGWYLTSTEADEHAHGLDDVVTGLLNMPGRAGVPGECGGRRRGWQGARCQCSALATASVPEGRRCAPQLCHRPS